MARLPMMKTGYQGREPNAPWRKDAEKESPNSGLEKCRLKSRIPWVTQFRDQKLRFACKGMRLGLVAPSKPNTFSKGSERFKISEYF